MMELARQIAEAARDQGWKLLVVGGFVRDMCLGLDPKDLDCEVYGVESVEALLAWASRLGEVNAVGRSFGVLKLRLGGVEIDLSLPRRESKVGAGHKGFLVEPDPALTPREAAARRDFTWNAMAWDPIADQVLDFYGGLADLEAGVLRHTSPAFAEDPLRVLRGFQFCGRFDLIAAPGTLEMCRLLLPEYDALAKERVWGEWEKWAQKSSAPSAGLQSEGDVWAHTLATVDAMARICDREGVGGRERTELVLAALLHDVGKPATTQRGRDGRVRSHGHAEAGVGVARKFLESIGAPRAVVEVVRSLVREHMAHVAVQGQVGRRAVRRLASRLAPATIRQWAMVVEADHSGRPPLPSGLPVSAAEIVEVARELAVEDAAPKCPLMGHHLIEMGLTPGPHFGRILRAVERAFLDGEFRTVEEGKAWLKRKETRR